YEIMCMRGRGCNWVLRLTQYLKPSIVLLPLQMPGPNIGSQNDAEVQGDDYQDGMVWDDDTQSWKWPNP
uniref:hypothetical protein n=1 Tax=Hoylesella timonensis TaxID=386414 RepID=UPI0028894C22